jgi:peptidoglycan/xylan/chitin deacetylase (PgdA/CDA1 family)
VILTFDDGYADAYTNAFPILKKYGMTATFFVVTEWLDTRQPGYLTWDQVREMSAAGMSIQSHTRTHRNLIDGCDYNCRVYQILGSVETIEAEIGIRPRFFCYPSGRYDAAVLPVLEQIGIAAAVTTQAGTLHVSDRPLELKRARIRGTTTVRDLAWMMNDWWQ